MAGANAVFVMRDLGLNAGALAANAGFSSLTLSAPGAGAVAEEVPRTKYAQWAGVDWRIDAKETVQILSGNSWSWLVVDHYAFDLRWHQVVAGELGVKTVIIDDLADRPIAADMLIDHNVDADHRSKFEGRVSDRTWILGGPRFALLGPAFVSAKRYDFDKEVRSIGIFMGGIDEPNVSQTTLEACRVPARYMGPIEIATTSYNPNLANLRQRAANDPACTVSVDLPNLAEFFARHDLQIGAGGGASLERAMVGVPSLLLMIAENQRVVVHSMAQLGVAVAMEGTSQFTAESIGEYIAKLIADSELRAVLAQRSRLLVDGRGATRVALAMMKGELRLRKATREDAEMMFAWRNHSQTRAASLDSRELDLATHVQWLISSLANDDRLLMIGHVGTVDVGVIRFDTSGSNAAEVSLYLDPELHGVGLGKCLLRAGEEAMGYWRESITKINATVLAENSTSKNLFVESGYRFDGKYWWKAVVGGARHGEAL